MIEMATGPELEWFRFGTATDTATTTCPIKTPSTTAVGPDCLWSSRGAVPYPENTFQVIEKHSKLEKVGSTSTNDTHWLCVKQDGWFGFQNIKTGTYLGHDCKSGIQASAPHLKQWELWTPREHPEGGHELLSPCGGNILMILCVDGDESTLVRRRHGTTLWEFVRV